MHVGHAKGCCAARNTHQPWCGIQGLASGNQIIIMAVAVREEIALAVNSLLQLRNLSLTHSLVVASTTAMCDEIKQLLGGAQHCKALSEAISGAPEVRPCAPGHIYRQVPGTVVAHALTCRGMYSQVTGVHAT
jgi:hypothetical protein